MTAGEATLEHVEHPEPATGIDNRKLGMWIFLASECLFFGSMIATYLLFKGRSLVGPYPEEIYDIPFTSVSSFVLLMSSLTMVLAVNALANGDQTGTRVWLISTALLGATFLGGQFFEFTAFVREGLTMQSSVFGSSFYMLTGFHGAHVAVGVVMLLALAGLSFRGRLSEERGMNVELVGLYWHFVDIVWIAIFTLIYLIP